MKRILIAAVMMGLAGGAYAADFSDLGGLKAAGSKALATAEDISVPMAPVPAMAECATCTSEDQAANQTMDGLRNDINWAKRKAAAQPLGSLAAPGQAARSFQPEFPVSEEDGLTDLDSMALIPAPDVVDSPEAAKEVPSKDGAVPAASNKSYLTAYIRGMVRDVLALNSRSGRYSTVYTRLLKKWIAGITILQPSPGRDFVYCVNNPRTLAFTQRGSNTIYMCSLLTRKMGELETAQTLIHETAHVAGYHNECDATILEVYAMKNVGLRYYQNGYYAVCGL